LQNVGTLTEIESFFQHLETAPASALLLDYDGTLAPFHVNRLRAFPYAGVVPILERIVGTQKTRVVIISGRPIAELRTLLSPVDFVEMWGSHGMERLSSDGSYACAEINQEQAALLGEAEERIYAAGLLPQTEIKCGGIAIHWRGMSPDDAARVQALASKEWAPLTEGSGLKLLQFEAGLELRVAHPNKGDAIRSVLGGLDEQAPVAFLGDDITDEDAFRVLNTHGLPILVKDVYRETMARAWIQPPEQLIQFLQRWLSSIEH
jgi:trehalose 6-phosphate phosphatase